MPVNTFSADTIITSAAHNENWALAVLTDTVRTITVSHVYTASQTFTGGWTAGAACTISSGGLTTTTLAITQGAIISGTYTPTLTGVANVGASTAYVCQYHRTGNVVSVSGQLDVDPTSAATLTQVGISLPIASNLASATQCAGGYFRGITGAVETGLIEGDATNNRAALTFYPAGNGNASAFFVFTYLIV